MCVLSARVRMALYVPGVRVLRFCGVVVCRRDEKV
jgi:hypothetical protein